MNLSTSPQQDCVAIGTIHAAKGREYSSVVIPEFSCDLSCLPPDQVEEERVLYVGVTRAQESTLITCADRPQDLHPFLRELRPGRAPRRACWRPVEDRLTGRAVTGERADRAGGLTGRAGGG